MIKKQLLNNYKFKLDLFESKLPNSRALIIDSSFDIRSFPRLNNYFDIVIVEGDSLALTGNTEPDIQVSLRTSAYTDGIYDVNYSNDKFIFLKNSFITELKALKKQNGLFTCPFLLGGDVNISPNVVQGIEAGLSEGYEGIHIATILGATTIYDTQGRTEFLADLETLNSIITTTTKYNISTSFVGVRPTLINKI